MFTRVWKRVLLTTPWIVLYAASTLSGSPAKASERHIDYSKVTKAEGAIVRERSFRYLVIADNPCLTIQSFRLGHPSKPHREKFICSLGEARFDRDFALVDFKTLDFHDDRLDVEVEFTPSRRGRKVIRWCSIALQPDSIGDLVCNR
ncbi:hypothetical protein [Stenotrophomonas maltophilia]|uniref:hypothetical protein n=1 Tax=Stenotrophomonas maltophilia TaxID=40324 RepID=UPI001C98E851|nr:hypothetical protein [Stenotrophomonas maltophilia]MBY6282493.1 hypothetical protein [Stenotrophomonas maltophilia]